MPPFSEILRERMDQYRYDGEPLNDATLALLLGLNRSSVSKWRNDRGYPSERQMMVMSGILQWDADDPVWLSTRRLPPVILDFLCDTEEGRKVFESVRRIYHTWHETAVQ